MNVHEFCLEDEESEDSRGSHEYFYGDRDVTRMECRHGDEVVSRAYPGGHIVDESNARSVEEPSVLSRFCPCYSIDRIERAQVHSDLDDYI